MERKSDTKAFLPSIIKAQYLIEVSGLEGLSGRTMITNTLFFLKVFSNFIDCLPQRHSGPKDLVSNCNGKCSLGHICKGDFCKCGSDGRCRPT